MRYKEIIQKGQKKITQFSGIKRELPSLDSLWNLKKIITILGGRKVGKTYSLLQQIQEAINTQKCTLEEVIFIDFSELDYRNINIDDLHSYVGSLGIEHPVYCFDEIQEVKDFDRQLISLYNQGCTLFITGSNSKMLSADIATILRGKTYEIRQTPLSFQEFLRFKNYETLPNDLILDQLFDEFVYRGGYPEVVLTPDERVKKGLLQGYLDLLIFKDLVDRYNIRNQALLQSFIRSLVLGHTKELNIHKLFNTYKSQGIEVGKNTLYEYLENLKHTFIISTLGQFYRKAQFEKVYLIDTGLLHCFTDNPSRWPSFETVIYQILQKQGKKLGFVKENFEIDFTDGERNIQVCWQLSEENRERESKFADYSQHNVLISRYDSTFHHSNIQMQNWKEIVLR